MEKFTVDNGQAKSKWDVESMEFERPSSFDEAVELFGEKAVKTALWTFAMSDSNLPVWLRAIKNASQKDMTAFWTMDHSLKSRGLTENVMTSNLFELIGAGKLNVVDVAPYTSVKLLTDKRLAYATIVAVDV